MRDNWPDSQEFWRNERVIVTGGAGFLGSYVVEKLQERRAAEVFVPRSAERYNESEPVNLGAGARCILTVRHKRRRFAPGQGGEKAYV